LRFGRGSVNTLLMNRYDYELARHGQKWRFKRITIDNAWTQGDSDILNALAGRQGVAREIEAAKTSRLQFLSRCKPIVAVTAYRLISLLRLSQVLIGSGLSVYTRLFTVYVACPGVVTSGFRQHAQEVSNAALSSGMHRSRPPRSGKPDN
jgi:hypothetical protein